MKKTLAHFAPASKVEAVMNRTACNVVDAISALVSEEGDVDAAVVNLEAAAPQSGVAE